MSQADTYEDALQEQEERGEKEDREIEEEMDDEKNEEHEEEQEEEAKTEDDVQVTGEKNPIGEIINLPKASSMDIYANQLELVYQMKRREDEEAEDPDFSDLPQNKFGLEQRMKRNVMKVRNNGVFICQKDVFCDVNSFCLAVFSE